MKQLAPVDVAIVGGGWAGGIVAKELGKAGLRLCLFERGPDRRQQTADVGPSLRDELRFAIHHENLQNLARDTVTFRNHRLQTALPMRRIGAFQPGEGVGGSGAHWNGVSLRWGDEDFCLASRYRERYGAQRVDADMQLADWGLRYDELRPFYDRYERTAGVSGWAGNIGGVLQPGGNPFEPVRDGPYPMPPLDEGVAGVWFAERMLQLGLHPFPRPTANASQPYVTPDGVAYRPCAYCGFCDRFDCGFEAKGSPDRACVDVAQRHAGFRLRSLAHVTRVRRRGRSGWVEGVEFIDLATGEPAFQPAEVVVLAAYTLSNVHLLLVSGIGTPYDPLTGRGGVGRGYCYQSRSGSAALFYEHADFRPYRSHGGTGTMVDDFHGDPAFDRSVPGFVGGATLSGGLVLGRPLAARPLPPGTPAWGPQWKRAVAKWYPRTMVIGGSGSMTAHRWNWCDLDPTYRNAVGQPLLRITFDFQENERRISRFMAARIRQMVQVSAPDHCTEPDAWESPWSIAQTQSTHNAGGTPMGTDPSCSVVTPRCQVWDAPNLFVLGASTFAHNSANNPTALVGALAYRGAADILRWLQESPATLLDGVASRPSLPAAASPD
jgi:gluconate 2-dehydrogenase alpha chain